MSNSKIDVDNIARIFVIENLADEVDNLADEVHNLADEVHNLANEVDNLADEVDNLARKSWLDCQHHLLRLTI